jgi:NAD-dependent SIR2 family protein deacetylase
LADEEREAVNSISDDNAVFDCDDDYDEMYEPTCTHCGGDACMEANEAHNDYINYDDELVKCPYCRGTGLRKHQTIF